MQPYQKRMTSALIDTLIVKVYPGEYGEFTLYEDDGISDDFKNGRWLKTKLTYTKLKNNITITIEPYGVGYDGMPEVRNYIIELPMTGKLRLKYGSGELSEQKIHIQGQDIMKKIEIELEETENDQEKITCI